MWAEVRKLKGHKQEAPVVDGLTADSFNQHYTAVWLSGNALASIDVVALRQTRLLGWVTVCGRVNHFGM